MQTIFFYFPMQTSAYAEMDPWGEWAKGGYIANLRICGDGPINSTMYVDLFLKPPHMRRWTLSVSADTRSYTQTSAYAEMDPGVFRSCMGDTANLRICGDGPTFIWVSLPRRRKPPHMRRWTLPPEVGAALTKQTSAYAEMDPGSLVRSASRVPNLRICGDGPVAAPFSFFCHAKPPHMRRWTLVLGDHPLALPQTSAYAEMDLPKIRLAAGDHANLRICGDGPVAS